MTSQTIPVEPFDFVVFGATGDLAERKLLPALYQRQRAGQFSEPTRIIGASRSGLDQESYRAFARGAIEKHVKGEEIEGGELARFLDRIIYVPVNARSGEGSSRACRAACPAPAIRPSCDAFMNRTREPSGTSPANTMHSVTASTERMVRTTLPLSSGDVTQNGNRKAEAGSDSASAPRCCRYKCNAG